MEQRPDRRYHQHRHHWRSDVLHRHLRGGINPGEDPGDQPQPEPEPEPEPVEKKTYNFTSYAPDGETVYATGTAETTGDKKTFNEADYAEIEVKTNSIPEWVGRKYYIIANATADGTTKYDLYDAEGQTIGVKVSVTEA